VSAALRTHRVRFYAHEATHEDGHEVVRYRLTPSAKPDRAWWASIAVPTGRELGIGAQADRQVDAVFGVAVGVLVDPHGLVRDVAGQLYRIVAVLPRRHGVDERQILAEHVDGAALTIVGED
jgi:hypothetical protein